MNASQTYKLAGYNLLYRLWEKKGKPVNCGWSVTADDLLRQHDETFNANDFALVIDFDPNSLERVGLVEIGCIHVFTYGDEQRAYWSSMMLELRDVYYEEFNVTPESKSKIFENLELKPLKERQRIVEFLYLQGDSWGWGRNGGTNAAFILPDAHRYFNKFFNIE